MVRIRIWIIILPLLYGTSNEGIVKMKNYNDNYSCFDENEFFQVALLSVLGDRDEQQDSAGFELNQNEGIVCVCDGMGGHEGGKMVSNLAVDCLLTSYSDTYPYDDIHNLLIEAAKKANADISSLKHNDGTKMQSGTTTVSVVIKKDKLFWISVGDSRLYLFRNDETVRATTDHNYRLALDEAFDAGVINEDKYNQELHRGEALISFLGVGKLNLIDSNKEPVTLLKNDKLLLMTDGLYKLLSDEEIGKIVFNFANISEATQALEIKAKKKAKSLNVKRDNMTIALIKIK